MCALRDVLPEFSCEVWGEDSVMKEYTTWTEVN